MSLSVRPKNAVAHNHRPQTAPSLQKIKRAGRECLVHPVAGAAFLRAAETHPLNLKLLADELIQVHASRNDIAAERRGRLVSRSQRVTNRLVSFPGEKGDLAFI